jgi:hypothetical protein
MSIHIAKGVKLALALLLPLLTTLFFNWRTTVTARRSGAIR